jgi:hypothetical protein
MFSDTFVISKKHLKANNHSMGENSPILVTLILKLQLQRSFSSNQFCSEKSLDIINQGKKKTIGPQWHHHHAKFLA